MTKRCKACRKRNPDDEKYCINCGEILGCTTQSEFNFEKQKKIKKYTQEEHKYDKKNRVGRKILAVIITIAFIYIAYSSFIQWQEAQIREEELKFVGTWIEDSSKSYYASNKMFTFYEDKRVEITTYYDSSIPEIEFKKSSDEKSFTVESYSHGDNYRYTIGGTYYLDKDELNIRHDRGPRTGGIGYLSTYRFSNNGNSLYYNMNKYDKIDLEDNPHEKLDWSNFGFKIKNYNEDGTIKYDEDFKCFLSKEYLATSSENIDAWGQVEYGDVISFDHDSSENSNFEIYYTPENSLIFNNLYLNSDLITVKSDGSGDFEKIQDAIDNTKSGEIIFVCDGLYEENIQLKDGIVLIGQDNKNTIISAAEEGSVVKIIDVGEGTIISNFKITNGNSSEEGGGVYMDDSHAKVLNNYITNNYAVERGAGIYIDYGCDNAVIANNLIEDNGGKNYKTFSGMVSIEPWYGGGISCHSGNTLICNNIIKSNTGLKGAGIYLGGWYKDPLITNNVIYANIAKGSGGGIAIEMNCKPNVTNNIIAQNTGSGVYSSFLSYPNYDSNHFYKNSKGSYSSDSAYGGGSSIGSPSSSSSSNDPKFAKTPDNYFSLKSDSPCIDKGNNEFAPSYDFYNNPRPVDGDGDGTATVDIGIYEHQITE